MRRTIPALVGILSFAAVAAGSAAAAPPAGLSLPAVSAADEHRRIVEFWTPERRASAQPRDLVLRPNARPGGGGGGGGGSTTVTGATWTGGGSVTVTTGKVFFTLGSSRYTCSASAVGGGAGNLVLTAGHCVHDGNGGAFATNWIFYPGWDGAPKPALGSWTATDLFTTTGWATGTTSFDDDAGVAVVTGGTSGGPSLATVLGAWGGAVPGIAFGVASGSVSAFGYPAAKKYKGNTLTYCAGPVRAGYDGNQTMALACDMTGGSSGGPWFQPFSNGTAGTDAIVSLNSYGYASLSNTMFGPIFDGPESTMYGAAASTPDCPAAPTGFRCVDYAD